jgi:LemA protein
MKKNMENSFSKHKTFIIIGAVVLFALLIIGWFVGAYNGLVSSDENVNAKWANVQSAYQRRADLIPNLVSTVQGAATFEKETQTKIAELRTGAVAAQQAMKSAQTPAEIDAASQQVESSIAGFKSLNINVEAYPQLRSIESFLSLQDELAGTENRIKVERDNFNTAVKEYNIKVRTFPRNIVANMFGFGIKTSFESKAGADVAPEVKF